MVGDSRTCDYPAGLPLLLRPEGPVEIEGSADQSQVGERLREIAKRFAGWAGLFRVDAEMIRITQHLFEEEPGVVKSCGVGPAGPSQSLDEPERAHVESSLSARQAIRSSSGVIAVDQAIRGQPTLVQLFADRVNCADHSRVVRGHEEDQRHQQAGCIQGIGTVALDKRSAARVPSSGHHFLVNLVASFQPTHAVGRKGTLLRQAQTAIESDPGHDLGIDEIPAAASYFPDALILSFPVIAQPVDQRAQTRPAIIADRLDVLVVEVNRIHEFTVNVELKLLVGGIADSNRREPP